MQEQTKLNPIRTPEFDDYFEYLSYQKGDNTELADNWLIDKFSDYRMEDLTYSQFVALKTELNAVTADIPVDKMPIQYQGKTITFVDPPAKFFHAVQAKLQKNIGEGLHVAVHTCYQVDGRPIQECKNELDYHFAELMARHHINFFQSVSKRS